MYSRNYYPTETEIKVPENYDGTMFSDNQNYKDDTESMKEKNPPTIKAKKETKHLCDENGNEFESVLKSEQTNKESKQRSFFGSDFFNIIKGFIPQTRDLKSLVPKIETEELIIIGIAAFMFFSKNGDRECALILLALIFIQ